MDGTQCTHVQIKMMFLRQEGCIRRPTHFGYFTWIEGLQRGVVVILARNIVDWQVRRKENIGLVFFNAHVIPCDHHVRASIVVSFGGRQQVDATAVEIIIANVGHDFNGIVIALPVAAGSVQDIVVSRGWWRGHSQDRSSFPTGVQGR